MARVLQDIRDYLSTELNICALRYKLITQFHGHQLENLEKNITK